MLIVPEKVLLAKLYNENLESATAALRCNRHKKGIRTGKNFMTNSNVKRIISKFETMGCLDNRPSTSANAARTVQEEMEIVAVSSMHDG